MHANNVHTKGMQAVGTGIRGEKIVQSNRLQFDRNWLTGALVAWANDIKIVGIEIVSKMSPYMSN